MTRYQRLGAEAFVLGASLFLGSSLPAKWMQNLDSSQQQPAPDNTKSNQRDRDPNSPTADQQKMNPADRAITKKIRQALHEDKALSMYAHNVKIITQDGRVTLKGPVRSQEEKTSIAAKASAIVGEGNVTDQLEIAAPKS